MPDDFNLTTEIGFSTTVLIIDEIGEFVTSLVDELLSRGFNVNYYGCEKIDVFDYLLQKKSFNYVESLADESIFTKLDYVYYFPKDNLENINQVVSLRYRFAFRLLIATYLGFGKTQEIEDLCRSKEFNFKLVFFKDVFGPRVVTSRLGKIIASVSRGERVIIEHSAEELISPLYSDSLIKELLKISFLPFGKGRIFIVKAEEINFEELVSAFKNVFTEVEVTLKEKATWDNPVILPQNAKEIVIRENLLYHLEEVGEWFSRSQRKQELSEEQIIVTTDESPRFSTEVVEETLAETPAASMFSEVKEDEPQYVPEKAIDIVFAQEQSNQPSAEASNIEGAKEEVKSSEENNSVETFWQEKKKEKRTLKKGALFVFLFAVLFFCFFALPLTISLVYGLKGIEALQETKSSLETGNFSQATETSAKAGKYLNISRKTILGITPFYSLIGLDKKVKTASDAISFSVQINQSLGAFLESFGKVTASGMSFIKGESVDWEEVQDNIKTSFSYAYQQASLAQTAIKEAEKGFKYLKQDKAFTIISSSLQPYREKLLKGEGFATALPSLAGMGGRKTYLVLFQNNLELRPTGGFISAFGLMNLENGKLVSFEVKDIYQADSQLKGQTVPPEKIKTVLGEENWYFRDSNFDPEFAGSAVKALWFLDKEMQVTADGVIAVNLNSFRDFLKILNGVELDTNGEKITSDNLLQKVIQFSEVGNLDGGQPKEEFIVSLAKAIFERLKTANSQEIIGVEGIVFSQLESKEILFYATDAGVQSQISELGWDGNLRQYQKKIEGYSIFNDYLFVNEANLGVNKANYFLKRKMEQNIKIGEQGSVSEKLTIDYENQSPSNNWPAGDYKNYLRVYLPLNSRVTTVLQTDPGNEGIWIPFPGENFEIFEENEKTVLGLLFNVPTKQKVKIEINYELEEKIELNSKINSYLLMVQKQSGSYSDEYSLIVTFPSNLVPLRVIPKAVIGGSNLVVNEKLSKDLIFQIDLAR